MTVFLVDLESVPTRYTCEWKQHFPQLLRKAGHNVNIISGPTDIPSATTPGAFLNFGGTNIYKAKQVEIIGRLFCDGAVRPGDHFIFTDAWHPGIIHAFDYNYFATDFHIKMFYTNLLNDYPTENPWFSEHLDEILKGEEPKIVRTGWPMEYMVDTLENYNTNPKRDLILFPHRIAPEKQVEIFRDLATHLPQYEFIVCQDTQLDKHEYHKLLGRSKIVFSANLQETLGISCYEGALVDAVPMVPDRLSYSEMYYEGFKYPSKWTQDWDSYLIHRQELCHYIIVTMTYYEKRLPQLRKQAQDLTENFFSCNTLLTNLK